jgi:hypothetical protein
MTTTLNELSPEQLQLCDNIAAEFISYNESPLPINMEHIERWLTLCYGYMQQPMVKDIRIVGSVKAALALATELTGVEQRNCDNVGASDSAWVAFYTAWHKLGVLTDEESKDVLALKDFISCAWDHILLDEAAIVIQRPTFKTNEQRALHCNDGPAVTWPDGGTQYWLNGTYVSERIVMQPQSFTRQEYLDITNTEIRRAYCTHVGYKFVFELLGAEEIDMWIDEKTNLIYKLFACKYDPTIKILQQLSPPLADGSQPVYLEPVHEDLRTAQAARKWQATEWSPEDCEDNPELEYQYEA